MAEKTLAERHVESIAWLNHLVSTLGDEAEVLAFVESLRLLAMPPALDMYQRLFGNTELRIKSVNGLFDRGNSLGYEYYLESYGANRLTIRIINKGQSLIQNTPQGVWDLDIIIRTSIVYADGSVGDFDYQLVLARRDDNPDRYYVREKRAGRADIKTYDQDGECRYRYPVWNPPQ